VLTDLSEEHIASIFRVEKNKLAHLLSLWFLAQLIFSTLKMEAICSSETLVDNGLLSVISQKMVLFVTIAVRTSNPT
jgi:hypothetical protein